MARAYRPATPFTTPIHLLIPTVSKDKGVKKFTYPEAETAPVIFGSFKTYLGSQSTENGVVTVVDTGYIDTWFRPDINSNCRLTLAESGETYEIFGDPEDIEKRHQFLKIRVRKIGGTDGEKSADA